MLHLENFPEHFTWNTQVKTAPATIIVKESEETFEMGLAFLQSAIDKIKRVESSSELRQSRRLRIRVRRLSTRGIKSGKLRRFQRREVSSLMLNAPRIIRGAFHRFSVANERDQRTNRYKGGSLVTKSD